MSKVLNTTNKPKAGSRNASEPRLVGDILSEILSSDSPLAKGYRKHLAATVNAEKGDKQYV